jgi:hypothetical protein
MFGCIYSSSGHDEFSTKHDWCTARLHSAFRASALLNPLRGDLLVCQSKGIPSFGSPKSSSRWLSVQ